MTSNKAFRETTDVSNFLSSSDLSPLKSIAVVIPAAGIGSRMQASKPKQYLEIHGKTIIEHTLQRFLSLDAVSQVVVAISPNDHTFSSLACAEHPKLTTVFGGETRAESVLAGLKSLDASKSPWVLVHDAARPNIKHSDIHRLLSYCNALDASKLQAGAILAAKVRDTIKHGVDEISHTVPREQLWQALTPQCCRTQWLTRALEDALQHDHPITDEASALEEAGYRVGLVAGDPWNIKVTQPEDLALMSLLLASNH